MGARILRIELRRSVALGSALLIAAVGVFVLFASNPPYRSWMELVIVQRDILQLTWPLALAAGAWQGIRERRSRVEELMATTPRPRWQRVLPIATAMAIGAVAAYLVMLAGAAGHLRYLDAYFPTSAVPLITLGALSMVGAVWLGLAIGALLPSPLTPPLLAVVGFVALAMSPMLRGGEPGSLLLFPYLQGPRDGGFALQMLSARANLSQALWFAAVAFTGLALFAAARPVARVAAVLPVVLGVAIAMPAMPRQLAAAWVEDSRATEVICTSDEPRVCLLRLYSYALDELRGPARKAVSILAAKLPPAPSRVLVWDSGGKPPAVAPPPDTLLVAVSLSDDWPTLTQDDLLWIMLDGAGVGLCPNLIGKAGESNPQYLAARRAAAAWLLDRDPPPSRARSDGDPEAVLAQQALSALRAVPADEQRARVSALRDAERSCAADDWLGLLTGGPR